MPVKARYFFFLPAAVFFLFFVIACAPIIKTNTPSLPAPEKPSILSSDAGAVSLIAVGDIMLGRTVGKKISAHKNVNYPFLKTAGFLRTGDLVFGNLENPLTPGPATPVFQMRLRADEATAQALKNAGFTILSLANNHTLDFGQKGRQDTRRCLDQAGIHYVGAGHNSPVYLSCRGLTFAFLAYSYPALDTNLMSRAVKAARQKTDFVVVSMHAGAEYTDTPNQQQVVFAHQAIDAGADLVIGHHPHVIQPLEKYKGKYIFYSLGNFVFDQKEPPATQQGLAVKFIFSKNGLNAVFLRPVVIKDYTQPDFLFGPAADAALQRLRFPLVDLPPLAFSLSGGILTITRQQKIIWSSPKEWEVDDYSVADSNNDGLPELNLSVWKAGNYGPSRPFWVKSNDPSIKNHFFVYKLKDGLPVPLWHSSNLEAPNRAFKIFDVDSDGQNELVVIEGDYAQPRFSPGHFVAVWRWNGWGFSNEWRSAPGTFTRVAID